MVKKVAWGIIGCGNVCEKKSGPGLYKTPGSDLVAVMRRNESKAADFAKRHRVDRFYTKVDDLIHDEEVNAIYIATPPDTHKEYTLRALQAGKPVYVEKPMALTYASCLEMLEASQKYDQRLFVAYYRRAQRYFLQVKELIDNGSIGRVQNGDIRCFRKPSEADQASTNWRLNPQIGGDGYFYDLAPHVLDILDFLLGQVSEASGLYSNTGGLYSAADTVGCTLKFGSGAIVTGLWGFASHESSVADTVILRGEKGEIHFSTFFYSPIRLIIDKGVEEFNIPAPECVQQPLIETIVRDLLNNTNDCPSTGISAARTSWVIDRIMNKATK